MDIQSTPLQLPSFILYPIATQDMKTCYQSQHTKLFCSLNGPYYDRKINQLQPFFNISITNAQQSKNNSLQQSQLIKLQHKLQQILKNILIKDKYQRMIFDINIEIIQRNLLNPFYFILAPIVNLVSYSCMIKSLEIQSTFSCSVGILRNGKLKWEYQVQDQRQKNNDDKILVLCSDQRDKRIIMSIYQGEYTYIHFQKLSSGLIQANDQINRYQLQKVTETYDIFHQ